MEDMRLVNVISSTRGRYLQDLVEFTYVTVFKSSIYVHAIIKAACSAETRGGNED